MSKPAVWLGLGASGSYFYTNRDALGELIKDGPQGLLVSITSPRPNAPVSSDVRQLQDMVASLSTQLDTISRNQKVGREIIITNQQPSTILGVSTWKVVGLVGTAGAIYLRLHGYQLRDLVYVSKRHFNTVAEALQKQYENLEESVKAVRTELLTRLGWLETKIDDSTKAIEAKLECEVGKLSDQVEDVSQAIHKLNSCTQETSEGVRNLGQDLAHVKTHLGDVSRQFDQRVDDIQAQVAEMRDSTAASHSELRTTMHTVDGKLDHVTRTTQASLSSLQLTMQQQSRGIELLCKFVRETYSKAVPSSSSVSDVPLIDSRPSWLDEMNSYMREYTVTAQPQRAVNPLMRRRTTSGLAGLKTATISAN